MIPIMPDEEFQKLSEEEQNAQWDRELDSMTEEDWDRFRWINSWNRRRRNLAPLLPCIRCGTAAIFEEDHEDMPYHNMFTLGCPKCHRYLETTTDLSPVQFGGGFGNQQCTFSIVQNRVPLHMVREWNYYNSPVTPRQRATLRRTGPKC